MQKERKKLEEDQGAEENGIGRLETGEDRANKFGKAPGPVVAPGRIQVRGECRCDLKQGGEVSCWCAVTQNEWEKWRQHHKGDSEREEEAVREQNVEVDPA